MGEVTPKEAQKIRDAETAENEATKQAIVKALAAQTTAPEAVREDSQAIVMRFIDEATSAIVAGIPLNEDEWAARLAAALAQPAGEPVPVAWKYRQNMVIDGKTSHGDWQSFLGPRPRWAREGDDLIPLFTHPSTEPDTLREIRNVIAEPLDPRIDLTNEWEDRLDRVDLIARTALSQGDTTP